MNDGLKLHFQRCQTLKKEIEQVAQAAPTGISFNSPALLGELGKYIEWVRAHPTQASSALNLTEQTAGAAGTEVHA